MKKKLIKVRQKTRKHIEYVGSSAFYQEILFSFLQGMQTIFESNYEVRMPLFWGALLKRV